MMKKIKDVFQLVKYQDATFYFMEFPVYDSSTLSEHFFRSPDNILKYERKITYEDGSEYVLPIADTIHVLPDRMGFMVIYDNKVSSFSKVTEYPWFFDKPNNAAIYNADGSFRFQLTIPNNRYDEYFYMVQGCSEKYPSLLCVILQSDKQPNNSGFYKLYAVNPSQAEIIYTGEVIRF